MKKFNRVVKKIYLGVLTLTALFTGFVTRELISHPEDIEVLNDVVVETNHEDDCDDMTTEDDAIKTHETYVSSREIAELFENSIPTTGIK